MNDIIVIGAGVVGAFIARTLAQYKLDVLVLEKETDVGDGASGANSAIIHSGYDPVPGTLKAKLNVMSNPMFDEICEDLDVKFMRIGSITVANTLEETEILSELANRSRQNKVPYSILDKQSLNRIEPNITDNALCGLYTPTAGIINPFQLVIGLMENAMDNGVELHLQEKVIGIEKQNDYFIVKTDKAEYITKWVINASGIEADKINEMVNPKSFNLIPRKGEYFVLDHFNDSHINHVLFNVPTHKGKGVLVAPTTHYNYLVGPSSNIVDDKYDTSTDVSVLERVKQNSYRLVDNMPFQHIIREFAGIRAVSDSESGDFIIEETSPHFINVAGIQSPGLTSSPAISLMVADMIPDKEKKDDFNPKRKKVIRLNEMTIEERQKLINENPKYGQIVCRCEKISAGEVIDSIRRNCGATTIKGVKKRVRPGFGKCQGGFCEPLIMKILNEELHNQPLDIVYGKKGSYILTCPSKNLNEEDKQHE